MFQKWEASTCLRFTEISDFHKADIKVRFVPKNHKVFNGVEAVGVYQFVALEKSCISINRAFQFGGPPSSKLLKSNIFMIDICFSLINIFTLTGA